MRKKIILQQNTNSNYQKEGHFVRLRATAQISSMNSTLSSFESTRNDNK